MKWLQDNWLMVFSVWCAVNAVASSAASKIPPTGFLGKTLHVFVAISPMDVLKAFKTVGSQLDVPVSK
jgi:hypothetical protein